MHHAVMVTSAHAVHTCAVSSASHLQYAQKKKITDGVGEMLSGKARCVRGVFARRYMRMRVCVSARVRERASGRASASAKTAFTQKEIKQHLCSHLHPST
jgi:hypothetical protein